MPSTNTSCSQGTAVMAGSIKSLSSTIKNQIKGVVLFGYTQNEQNDDQIPNYPKANTDIYCDPTDLVCDGVLVVTLGHFSYLSDAEGPAPDFLISKVGS
jgi:cutinase